MEKAVIRARLRAVTRLLASDAKRLRALIDALDGGLTGAECSLAYDTLTDAITRLEKAYDELG